MVKESNSVRNKKLRSSKPYDVSNSFVRKVTSRVTNLLPQSTWLSKWFTSSVDSEGQNKDALNSNDSGSEDEDTNAVLAPPSKRAKIPLNQQFPPNSFKVSPIVSDQGSSQQSSSSRVIRDDFTTDGAVAGPSGINTRQLVSSTPNIQPTASHMLAGAERKMNGDDRSESSESTSGCSSLVPQGNRQFQTGETVMNSLSGRRRSMDEKLNFTGHLQSPRSLFSDRSHSRSPRLNSSINRRRPSFNVSSFGSPILEKDKASAKNKVINSPFYSGRTTYGGASAYRMKDGFFVPNESTQKRCGVQVKPAKCASDSLSSMSTTARRILEALEQFSTPVLDAKRIPVEPSTPLLSSKRKRPLETAVSPAGLRLGQSPLTPNSARPQTSGLTIPTVPDLLKMRHREKLQDSLEAARLIAASSSSTPVSSCQSSSTSKYRQRFDEKTEKTDKYGSRMKTLERKLDKKTVEEVNLPNISLPVTSLPKFDFVVPPAASTPSVVSTFKFASPITVTENTRTCSSVDNFTFSKPLSAVGHKDTTVTNNNKINCVIPPEMQFISGKGSKLRSSGIGESRRALRKKSDNSETCFGVKPATELKTGSVMDILGKKEESTDREDSKEVSSSSSTLLDKFKPAPGTWECGTCMIRNKSDAAKCAACETPRSSAGSVSSSTTLAQVSSGIQFKKPAGTWECTSCRVQNLSSAAVCSKCATGKQNSAQTKEVVQPPEKSTVQPSGFGNKFKPASDTWECGTCLVRNPDSWKQCQACETKRPGLVTKTVSPPKPPVNFGFGDKFKKPAGTWECPTCMIQNKDDVVKCAACETSKPGTESQSTTKFSCPMPADAGAFKFGIDKAGDAAKESVYQVKDFVFGATVTTAAQFSFGFTSTPTTTKTTTGGSSNTTTANFSFGSPVLTTATSSIVAKPADTSSLPQGGFSFGVPQPSKLPSPSNEDKRPSEVPKRRRSSDSGDTVAETKEPKPNQLEGNSELVKPVSTVENKKSEEKPDKKKVSFSFEFTNKPSATTKTVDSTKPAFNFGAAILGAANISSVQPTTTTSSFSFTSSNTMAAVTTTVTTTVSTPVTTVSTSMSAAPVSLATTTSASNLFSFGAPKSSVTFGGSSGVGFGQPTTTTTTSFTPSFGAGMKTSTAPTFNFAQSKPFGGSNKELITTTASKETASSFGSITSAATIAPFGPLTTTTTTPASSSTSSSLPSFGTATTTPNFSLGSSRSTIPAFGTPSIPTSVPTTTNTTTKTTGFGSMVSAPNFGTGFSAVNEQKSTSSPATAFNFGSANNSSGPSLGQTAPFSFGGIQNDQGLSGKGAFAFGAPSNSSALGSGPSVNSGFGFTSNNPTSNQVGPTFSFGSNAASTSSPAVSSMFGSASAPNAVTVFGAGATGASSLFGTNNTSSAATPTTTAAAATTTAATSFTTPNFGFGSNNTQPSTNVFGFTGSQASGSQSFAAPTTNFPFGQVSTSAQSPAQPAPPTFNPNLKPIFNFTKGETPSFTASSPASPAPGATRRIKKAVRRTHHPR
ncbi:nuclear pore complex protein Nup153 [Periplaneta americana]|uniref:nuclear pore complex protein Nup153 n=1 Tax=Periplaneta americana TaxID=6978 RepID=UPI0037E8FAE8